MTESLEQEIHALRSLLWAGRDPEGRVFAPLADAYRRAGDFRAAFQVLRDGLIRHPDFVPGHVVAAQIYAEKGLFEEAELAARRALELDSGNALAAELLVEALEGKGSLDEAQGVRARLEVMAGSAPRGEETPEPEPEPEPEAEPVFDMAALAPEPEPEPELEPEPEAEPVFDMAALAPEPEPEPEAEPVFDMAALAPEPETEPEAEPVFDMAALAPEPERVFDMAALAPEDASAEGTAGDDDLPSDEMPDGPAMVTRTMAELYARQGLTDRAVEVLQKLLDASPGDPALVHRMQELRGGAQPPARAGEAATTDSISTYFQGLLAWERRAREGAPGTGDDAGAADRGEGA